MSETHRWIGGISALIGAWVFVSAFVFDVVGATFWNNVVVGAAIFVFAGYSAVQASPSDPGSTWASAIAGLFGLWMIVAPFLYGATAATTWSSVISGILVAVLSGYNAYESSETTGPGTVGRTGA